MKRLIVLMPMLLSACSPAIDTAPLESEYVEAYPTAAVSCRVSEPYVLCQIVHQEFTAMQSLWIYENGEFFAINGKALTAAERMEMERYPEANSLDIPAILSQF